MTPRDRETCMRTDIRTCFADADPVNLRESGLSIGNELLQLGSMLTLEGNIATQAEGRGREGGRRGGRKGGEGGREGGREGSNNSRGDKSQ